MTDDRPVTVAMFLAAAVQAGLPQLANALVWQAGDPPEVRYEQVYDDRGRALMVHACGHPRWVRVDAFTVSRGRCGKCFGGSLADTWTPAYRRVASGPGEQ